MASKVVHHMEGLHGRQSDFMTFSSLSSVVETSGPVVWISPQASISATCDLLRTHKCLSLPVYDEEKRRILGLVDILDICGFLCWGSMNFFQQTSDKAVLDEQDRELKAKMNDVPIVDVLNAKQQHRGTLVVKRHLDSVCSLLDLMAQGLHRALVQVWPEDEDEEGQRLENYRLVAQVDLVRFLVDHKRNLNHHLIASSLTDLGLAGPAPSDPSSPASSSSAAKSLIYSTEEGKTALEAFRTMAVSGVHAIGIVGAPVGSADGNDQPRLLYNLSASDLRDILTPDTVHLLREPVEVFLARVQEKDPKGRPKNLVTCSPGDSLLQVMELVVRSKVHRVWVVDRQRRPLGLVTLTDILSKFASFDYALAQAAVKKTIVPLSLSSPH